MMKSLRSIWIAALLVAFWLSSQPGVLAASAPRDAKGPSPAPAAKETPIRWEIDKWPNGKIRKKTPYKAGVIEGVVEQYWDAKDNPIQSKTTYAAGLKQGPMTSWHHNGNMLNERTYKDDKLDGEDLQYHPAAKGKIKVRRQ